MNAKVRKEHSVQSAVRRTYLAKALASTPLRESVFRENYDDLVKRVVARLSDSELQTILDRAGDNVCHLFDNIYSLWASTHRRPGCGSDEKTILRGHREFVECVTRGVEVLHYYRLEAWLQNYLPPFREEHVSDVKIRRSRHDSDAAATQSSEQRRRTTTRAVSADILDGLELNTSFLVDLADLLKKWPARLEYIYNTAVPHPRGMFANVLDRAAAQPQAAPHGNYGKAFLKQAKEFLADWNLLFLRRSEGGFVYHPVPVVSWLNPDGQGVFLHVPAYHSYGDFQNKKGDFAIVKQMLDACIPTAPRQGPSYEQHLGHCTDWVEGTRGKKATTKDVVTAVVNWCRCPSKIDATYARNSVTSYKRMWQYVRDVCSCLDRKISHRRFVEITGEIDMKGNTTS